MKSFQVLFCSVILLYITAGFITPFTVGPCTSSKCFATFRFVIGKDMVDGHALLCHVFANVSVIGVKGCYRACQTNCRCISFNFMTHSSQENCQLNGENRHIKPSALKAVAGSQYYDLVVRYNFASNSSASSSSCPQCSNSCCRNQQCLNGGTCQENCQDNGKRFICDCLGFIGQICEQECQDALGMESRAIPDGQISASTRWSHLHDASNARLHNKAVQNVHRDAWIPSTADANQWLQIDLVTQYGVTRVATQGRYQHTHWVTKYNLLYGNDGSTFQYYRERGQNITECSGNTDGTTVVSHDLIPPIAARYIRFQPLTWHLQIAMRVELYGCQGNTLV